MSLWRAENGAAAAEMAMVFPFILILMFGALELGNLFLDEHALAKQVRDGARYASQLSLSEDFACESDVFEADPDSDAHDDIIKVTKDGSLSDSNEARWTTYWDRTCDDGNPTLSVNVRCVDKDEIDKDADGTTGIYTSLPGDDIPVVTVNGAVKYRSVLASIGIDATNICLRAESDVALAGA
ncbi:MAG TPA: TadE/TadG family type IV pilus assembly protein [Sphingomicrobium sp.]